jgi:hypothetical protein
MQRRVWGSRCLSPGSGAGAGDEGPVASCATGPPATARASRHTRVQGQVGPGVACNGGNTGRCEARDHCMRRPQTPHAVGAAPHPCTPACTPPHSPLTRHTYTISFPPAMRGVHRHSSHRACCASCSPRGSPSTAGVQPYGAPTAHLDAHAVQDRARKPADDTHAGPSTSDGDPCCSGTSHATARSPASAQRWSRRAALLASGVPLVAGLQLAAPRASRAALVRFPADQLNNRYFLVCRNPLTCCSSAAGLRAHD